MSLHVHSEYSALDGLSTVEEIGDRMIEIGCPYCGLTDHGVVAGHIEFDKAMRGKGLKPIFGCELYHGLNFGTKEKNERDAAHLIALAMTDEGLLNLWRLVNCTSAEKKFHYVGRVSNEDIEKYKEGILFTSACPLGLVPKGLLREDRRPLDWYLNTLGDNFRLEISTYPGDHDFDDGTNARMINEKVAEVAQERGIPMTYGDDGHYAFPHQFEWHDMYLAAQTKQSIYTPKEERKQYHPRNAVCIKDRQMVRESLHYLGESLVEEIIANTDDIGKKADPHLPSVERPHLPIFVPKDCEWKEAHEEEDPTLLFIDLVEKGIAKRYGGTKNEQTAWWKASHEIEVLIEDNLEHYFLMTWDIVKFCEKEGIAMGPGRGSSAGSIVAYALGITDVDPLHYDLFFERFWNKGRAKGFPDIDSDFATKRRGEVREYLIERWGKKRVCSIGTVKRMKPIALLAKMRDPCEISVPECKEIKDIVEQTHDIEIHGHEQIGWDPEIEPGKVIYVKNDVGPEIEQWIQAGGDREPLRRTYIEMCERVCSRTENYGIHPSGIVVSDIDLDAYAPAYRRGGKEAGVPATMFPMTTIEKLLLIKEDILGLKTLDTLSEWEKLVKEKYDFEPAWSGLDRTPLAEDPEVWKLLDEGFVAGIFQVETSAGRAVCESLRPQSVEDLGVIVALNRPGPQRAGIPNRYAARKEGNREVTYPHPMLEEILKPTYGLFVYQEQIIRFMWALGYSPGDGDQVRKILGKKEPERMDPLRDGEGEWEGKGYLEMAVAKGFDQKVAEEVWREIENFASYSFNKAHAIAYAIIGFRCLVAKLLFPEEFYIACIRTVEHSKRAELTPTYIKEARRADIKILPPDIRYSQADMDVHDGKIYFGFCDIKGMATGGEFLVELRDERGYDISTPEKLLQQIEEETYHELAKKKVAREQGKSLAWKTTKQRFNEKKLELLVKAGAWHDLLGESVLLKDKQEAEKEYLQVVLTDDTEEILNANAEIVGENSPYWQEALRSWSTKEDEYEFGGERFIDYRLPGIVTGVKPTKVRSNGKPMGIITIEYERHELTFACFSNKWPEYKRIFKPHSVGLFTIRHSPPTAKRSEGYHFEKGKLLTL